MNSYPYQGRNLFEQPERYRYADCSASGYLDGWRTHRIKLVERLNIQAAINVAEHPSDRSAIVASASAFDLYTYLENGLHRYKSGEMSSSQFWEMISPFVKKFEVFKRLYDTYGTDLLKSTGAQPASLACYVLFANCLAEYAERSRSLNALSTLLKLNDTLASVATDQMYSEVAEMLVRCIETELRLVDLIEKHSWDLP